MTSSSSDLPVLDTLQTAIGLLELTPTDPLRRDVKAIGCYLQNPNFRIAVFAPFNYGKSTLLNALLGDRTLPIDLIPTTGAAIVVKYGTTLHTTIRLTDGRELSEQGTKLLSQFAILDDQRRMRDDVAAIEVCCPHPFLQLGVEFVDLPGTDDREAQDALVKNQLLTADLVVQVLDARKLMTLQERETLRDWLLDRGIETVLFVVNFLNLLEPDDQKQVLNRLRFVAESFRAELPPGISNLYRVDALPALRAQLKGESDALHTSGLPTLETALQTIVQVQPQKPEIKQARLRVVTQQVTQALQTRIEQIQAEMQVSTTPIHSTKHQKRELKRKAIALIKPGFQQSLGELRHWLSPTHLLTQYETEAIIALSRSEFADWETTRLKKDWLSQKRKITDWVYKACDFLEVPRPADPWFSFPDPPTLPDTFSDLNEAPANLPDAARANDATPVAIATGLGWVLGGPLGAVVLGGASYILNQQAGHSPPVDAPVDASGNREVDAEASANVDYDSISNSVNCSTSLDSTYLAVIQNYFHCLSATALTALGQYEALAQEIFSLDWEDFPAPAANSAQQHQLALLQTTLERLQSVFF